MVVGRLACDMTDLCMHLLLLSEQRCSCATQLIGSGMHCPAPTLLVFSRYIARIIYIENIYIENIQNKLYRNTKYKDYVSKHRNIEYYYIGYSLLGCLLVFQHLEVTHKPAQQYST